MFQFVYKLNFYVWENKGGLTTYLLGELEMGQLLINGGIYG